MQIYARLFSVCQHNYIFMPILVIIIFSAIRLPASRSTGLFVRLYHTIVLRAESSEPHFLYTSFEQDYSASA